MRERESERERVREREKRSVMTDYDEESTHASRLSAVRGHRTHLLLLLRSLYFVAVAVERRVKFIQLIR